MDIKTEQGFLEGLPGYAIIVLVILLGISIIVIATLAVLSYAKNRPFEFWKLKLGNKTEQDKQPININIL